MNKSLINKRTKKIICFLIIAILIMLTISLFAVPELDTNAYAAEYGMKVVFNRDYYPFYDTFLRPGNLIEIDIVWYSTDFYPIEEVLWITDIDDGGQVSGEDMQTYSWTMENLEDSSITYAGSCMNGNSSWSGGNYPTIAGVYRINVSATYQNNTRVETEEITLRGYAQFEEKEGNPFEFIYDGNDYYNLLDYYSLDEQGLPQQINIKDYFDIVGNGSEGGLNPNYLETEYEDEDEGYYISCEWEMNITSVVGAGNYECELILTKNGVVLDYIDYGYIPHIREEDINNVSLGSIEEYFKNTKMFSIKKRPLMLAPVVLNQNGQYVSGSIFAQKEKYYNGNSEANAYLYENGTDSDRFNYLLEATKFDDFSGFLSSDLNSMVPQFDSTPLLKFNGVNFYGTDGGTPATFDSHFFIIDEFGNDIPSSTVSAYDEFGNIIYDKQIRVYYQPNVSYQSVMRNYDITLDGINFNNEYLTFDDVGAILPVELTARVRTTEKEYGLSISSMIYQLITGGEQLEEGYIGVEWYGDLQGALFNLVHSQAEVVDYNGINDIHIMIKVGRDYVPSIHSPNDIVFSGEDNSGNFIQLVEYSNDLPPIMDLYFYPIIYFNGEEVTQDIVRYVFQCGSLELNYTINKLTIKKKQLVAPSEVIVHSQKEYDGYLQANFENFNENSFDSQWVGNDGMYITARLKPVYENSLAGQNKQLTIDYILMLTEAGIAQNMSYLLDRYEQPSQETRTDAVITKKVIEFAFDMTNAIDKPNQPPYTNYLLFPEDKILTYDKAYGAPLPQIKDFIFGDYVYDGLGQIQYEQVFSYKASTYIDDYGREEYVRDFYGNLVYVVDESVPPVLKPKLSNGFISIDAYPDKIQFDDLIDWNFYGIPVVEGGVLKKIIISSYDPYTNEVQIIDSSHPDAVQMSVGENTPSTDNPGIGIQLLGAEGNEIELDNYLLRRKTTNYRAFIKITKRTPVWEMSTDQTYTYSGKQHSSMLDDINIQQPREEDYNTYEEYLLAYNNYLYKKATFAKIININLDNHSDYLEIIGSQGKGININIIEYAPPGQEYTAPISSYINENEITTEQILLLKYAGKYIIEVSLPETSLYSASEKRELTLVIKQKEIIVWLSNSEKDYGQPNPDASEILYKEDTSDISTWGWRFYSPDILNYKSTILYQGFIEGEGPDSIGIKTFKHCEIVYNDVDELSPPGNYQVTAKEAMAHNYSFKYSNSANLIINKIRAEIIIEKDEATVIYDPDKDAWTVEEIEEGVENPIAVYTYTASEDPTPNVMVNVVGYVPRDLDYDFSVHYVYMKDEFGQIVYDSNDNPIIINFNPIVIFHQGEWVAYEQGLTGEIRDCTPPIDYAKDVGQYIFKITANPSYFLEPMPKYVKFVIDYAETIVDINEEIIVYEYSGSSFRINGKASLTEDDNLVINNEEIDIYIKLEKSLAPFEEASYSLVYDYILYDDEMDTQIKNAGFYRVTFMLEYAQGTKINYNLPENNEYILRVEVVKGQVEIQFNIGEGTEEWYYRGIPYEVLDMNNYSHGDIGVTYSVFPEVPFENIEIEIYQAIFEDEQIIDFVLIDEAVNAGSYLFKLKARGDASNNYDDSEWIEQIFTIQKATVVARITGVEIKPEDQHLFPDRVTYPLSKIYGEEIIEERYKVIYEGWINGEDPYTEDISKRPAEFIEGGAGNGIIDWGELADRYLDARPTAPYSIRAKDIQSLNYEFDYRNTAFTVNKREGEVLVNEEYTNSVYTGTDQRFLPTFRAMEAPENIDDEIMPYAFALNHDPNLAAFTIILKAKLVYNPSTGEYDQDTEINDCVDVGRYIFTIFAGSSTNYTEVLSQEFEYEVVKAELKAIIEDNEIIYGEEYPSFTLTYSGYVGKDYEGMQENPSSIPNYALNNNGECILVSGNNRVQNLVHPQLSIPINAINVGNYIIGLTGGSADNYYINLDDTAGLIIKQKEITVHGSEYRVSKEYDGTMIADRYVSERNYEFIGVIKHYLKADEDVVTLSFSASFDSHEVGVRTVKMQELAIDNANYYLLTVEFDCLAEITKRTPNIRLFSASYSYDGTPKELIPSILGLPGDEVDYVVKYKGVGATTYLESSNPPTMAGTYEVIVTTDDLNYVSMNRTSTLTINKARVSIMFGGDKMQRFGSVTGLSARAIGLAGYQQALQVKYYDSEQQEILDITTAASGKYTVKASYNASTNYLSEQSQEELFIDPKSVSINFVDTSSYPYNGRMKHQIATFYNVNGELQETLIRYALVNDGEETFINIDNEGNFIYSIAPKDAGHYKAYAIAPSGDYELLGELTSAFEIVPIDINIKVNDITINEGSTPSYTYTIEGIAAGENINTLDVKPKISFYDQELGRFVEENPSAIGNYRILPYGAKDKNYNITYSEGKLTINSVKLVANTTRSEGLMLEGSFSPDTNLSVKVIQSGSYSKANTSFEVFKMNNKDYKPYTLSEIYDISIQVGAAQDDMITVKLLLNSNLKGAEAYYVAHIKMDGSVEVLEVTPSSDDYLVFSVSELGNFSVMVEESKSQASIGIYIAIVGAVLVILLGLIIIKKKA